MESRVNDRKYAIVLRKQGLTHREIRNLIPGISKSSISDWLKNIDFNSIQEKVICERQRFHRNQGYLRAAITNHQKKLDRIKLYRKQAHKEFKRFQNNPLFLVGLALYWAEGAKATERFHFMNSDPALIQLMLRWLKFIGVAKERLAIRLYIHRPYAHEHQEKFWANLLEVSDDRVRITFKPAPHKIKKNPFYRGCLRIDCGPIELFYKICEWKRCLATIYDCDSSLVMEKSTWRKMHP